MAVRAPSRRRLLGALGLGGFLAMTDFPDWNAPQGHATAISTTGAPLLNLHAEQSNQQATHIAPGASASAGQFTVNQPGYLFNLGAQVFTGTPAGPLTMSLVWKSSVSGLQTGSRKYVIWPGTAGNVHGIQGYGRNRGNQLTVTLTNSSSGATLSIGLLIATTSVPYTTDRVITITMPALVSGNTLGMYDFDAGIIGANDINTLAAATSRTDDLGMYQGKAWLFAQTASNTTDLVVFVKAVTDQSVTGQGQNVCKLVSNSVGAVTAEIELPGAQCQIFVQNNNAGAQRVNYQLATEDL